MKDDVPLFFSEEEITQSGIEVGQRLGGQF